MSFAMTAFIANDAMIKAIGERVPVAQMIVVRGLMAITLITLVAQRLGALSRVREGFRRPVLVRAGCEGLGTFFYLAALLHLPLANVTAINLSSPLFVALLAVLLLKEQVNRARWVAIGLGFAGVLLVVQPRLDDFNLFAWIGMLATLIYAFRDLLTRKIPASTPSILVTLCTAVVVSSMAATLLIFQGWAAMTWYDTGLLGIAAMFLSSGYYSIIAAMRHSELSAVAPFRYVGLLWALVIGYTVWGHVPNSLAWTGIVLLIGAGVFMIRQQHSKSA